MNPESQLLEFLGHKYIAGPDSGSVHAEWKLVRARKISGWRYDLKDRGHFGTDQGTDPRFLILFSSSFIFSSLLASSLSEKDQDTSTITQV